MPEIDKLRLQKDAQIQSLKENLFSLLRGQNSDPQLQQVIGDVQVLEESNQGQINCKDIIKCLLTEEDVLQTANDINDGRIPGLSRYKDLKPAESFDEFVNEVSRLKEEEKRMDDFMELYPEDTDSEDAGEWFGDRYSDMDEDEKKEFLLMERINSVIADVFSGDDGNSSDSQAEDQSHFSSEMQAEVDDFEIIGDELFSIEDCTNPSCNICEPGKAGHRHIIMIICRWPALEGNSPRYVRELD